MPISGVYLIPDKWLPSVFGEDAAVRKAASPLRDIHSGCPPFCILYGDDDFPTCNVVSERFRKALEDDKVPAESRENWLFLNAFSVGSSRGSGCRRVLRAPQLQPRRRRSLARKRRRNNDAVRSTAPEICLLRLHP